MIAMALACRPKLLIADEPTTALDVTIQAQILELIKELQEEEEMSVLFITHDMGVVAEIADRTVVMHGGEMVEQGATTRHLRTRHIPTLARCSPRCRALARWPARRARCGFRSSTITGTRTSRREMPDTVRPKPSGPCLVVKISSPASDPLRSFRHGIGPCSCGRGHLFRSAAWRDAGAGRRIRLRQIDDRTIDPAACRGNAGSVPIDGQDVLAANGCTLRR